MYQYAAKVRRVVDGDTVDLDVDLGFMVTITQRFRLDGINAPEMTGLTREQGKVAKAGLEALLNKASLGVIYVDSTGKDKYGRWIAKLSFVSSSDGSVVDVSQKLVAEELAAVKTY